MFSHNRIVIEGKVVKHHFYCWISIVENIFHRHEKIRNIENHLMLMEHDQHRRPIDQII